MRADFSAFLMLLLGWSQTIDSMALEKFKMIKQCLISAERSRAFGSSLKLTGYEILANKCLMAAKLRELNSAHQVPLNFLPAINFIRARRDIERSHVFKFIKRMPKGANLHAHSQAIASIEFIQGIMWSEPSLYVCLEGGQYRYHFFAAPDYSCLWENVQDLIKKNSSWLSTARDHLTMTGHDSIDLDDNAAWKKFETLFGRIRGIIKYRPVFQKYLYEAMQELYDDNVMYAELRTSLSGFYELDGYVLDPLAAVGIYKETIAKFKKEHPGFLGMKVIYAAKRASASLEKSIEIFESLRLCDEDFVVGFDLVGQEDRNYTLTKHIDALLKLSQNNGTVFFFHAGETKWFGESTDENLFDAIVLNTKRIGHGNALLKHPKLLQIVKANNITIEVNPISNQVLNLVSDLRNHPAGYFFANNFPVVVSNDDPAMWGAQGLSYDFYEAFMGIMSRRADLRSLKQLAMNSITFSAMSDDEKSAAFSLWEKSWETFVKDITLDSMCVNRW